MAYASEESSGIVQTSRCVTTRRVTSKFNISVHNVILDRGLALTYSSRPLRASEQALKLLLLFAGSLSLPLQLRPEGSVEKFAAGGPDQALWQPQEWSQ